MNNATGMMRTARLSLGMNQVAFGILLGDMLEHEPFGKTQISRWENRRVCPPLNIREICQPIAAGQAALMIKSIKKDSDYEQKAAAIIIDCLTV